MDMDRYLERRSLYEDDPEPNAPKSSRRKKKKARTKTESDSGKKSYLSGLASAIRAALDVDEVIDLDEVDEKKMSVFELTTFKDRLSKILRRDKLKDDLEITQESASVDEESLPDSEPPEKGYLEKSGEDMRRRAIGEDKSSVYGKADRIPKEEVDRVIRASGNSSQQAIDDMEVMKNPEHSEKPEDTEDSGERFEEFRSDLREVINITYKIMKKVPPETIKNFKNSEDFKRYVDILEKYNLLRKRPKSSE